MWPLCCNLGKSHSSLQNCITQHTIHSTAPPSGSNAPLSHASSLDSLHMFLPLGSASIFSYSLLIPHFTHPSLPPYPRWSMDHLNQTPLRSLSKLQPHRITASGEGVQEQHCKITSHAFLVLTKTGKRSGHTRFPRLFLAPLGLWTQMCCPPFPGGQDLSDLL